VKAGRHIPAIKLQAIINAPVKSVEPESLTEKVFWLEFWASYYGPCITAMAKRHEDKLYQIAFVRDSG